MKRVSVLSIIGKAIPPSAPKPAPVVVQSTAPRLIRQRVCATCDAVYIQG